MMPMRRTAPLRLNTEKWTIDNSLLFKIDNFVLALQLFLQGFFVPKIQKGCCALFFAVV